MNNVDTQIGKVIKSYELEGLVGTGGFGAVYRARQAVVEREVAIKIIWPAFANHPNFIRRFEAEAQLVAGLEHPHIVPLYDYWRDPDGAYIVMRYLRGGALRESMDEIEFSLRDVNRILGQICAALALAHRYGVVHRDIKPENILLDEQKNAYLADFGIAQIVSNAKENENDPMAGVGSPAYASPEQVVGELTSSQSDIYSLGIILYELLAREHPFPDLAEYSVTEMNEMRAQTTIPDITQHGDRIPRAINEVLQRATALNPKERFPDALSLARAFQEASGTAGRVMTTMIRSADADSIPNPFKGLRAFQETDSENFFGREALVNRLLNRLREDSPYTRFLAVVGPSGSGKSSVVKAGLIPQLRAGAVDGSANWYYNEIVPGTLPYNELENAIESYAVNPPDDLAARFRQDTRAFLEQVNANLPDDDSEFFLFIDQFEELFTLVEDDDKIGHFLESMYIALTAPESRIRIVITIRADFYDRPLLQPRLSDMVRERTEVVVPLSEEELQRAITEPARRVGVMIDNGLVAAIVAEVKEQPGALPLLQYALSELFERRDGNVITPDAYHAIGGVRGSLARRAGQIYAELEPAEKRALQQLMLRLITLGEGTEDTRRRTLLSEVTSLRDDDETTDDTAIMNRVIDRFGKARLLTFDRDPITRSPTVEVTHEAIIREWSLLRTWLDESRNDVRMQRSLQGLANEWLAHNRDESFLVRGARLDSYENWAETTTLVLSDAELAYLRVSLKDRERREQEERERQEREERLRAQRQRFLYLAVGVLVVGLVIAIGLTGVAFQAQQRAQRGERDAQAARGTADANAEISNSIALEASARRALADGDGDLAVLLSLESMSMGGQEPPVEAVSTLAQVAFNPGTRMVLRGHEAWVQDIDVSQNGQYVATGSTDASVRVWDARTGEQLYMLEGHTGDVESVKFAPTGTTFVSMATDFETILWDAATGQELQRFIGHDGPVRDASFSPDGSQIITGGNDALLILWDLATGQALRRFEGHSSAVFSVAFSPDGTRVLSGSRAGRLFAWDVATAQLTHQLEGHNGTVWEIAFSNDDTHFASASGDGTVLIWDAATLEPAAQPQLLGSNDEVRDVDWSLDDFFLYTASINRLIEIWDVETGLRVGQLSGHDSDVLSLEVSADGRFLYSGSKDLTARIWNVGQPGAERFIEVAGQRRLTGLALGNSHERLYVSSVDPTVYIIDRTTYETINQISAEDAVLAFDVSPDERRLLIGGVEFLREVEIATGEVLNDLVAHTERITDVIYLPDGQRALSASQDTSILLWDLTTGEVLRRFDGHTESVNTLALNPENSTQFASGSGDQTVIVWDLEAGALLDQLVGHTDAIYDIDYSPDGLNIISGSRDATVILWDALSGRELQRYISNTEDVRAVHFNAEGNRLAVGTADGVVAIYDPESSQALETFNLADGSGVFDVLFTPDSRNVLTAQEDGDVGIWRSYKSDELISWTVENRYLRDWTCVERERFFIEPLCD